MSLGALIVPSPVHVAVGPHSFTIPPYRADAWLLAIAEDPTYGVIPGMLEPDDRVTLISAMVMGEVTGADVQRAAREAVTAAAGRSWWEAWRLVGWCDQPGGQLYGSLLLEGIDPTVVTFGAWCTCLHALLLRNRDEKERTQLMFDLTVPPPGIEDDMDGWDTGVPAGFSAELPPGTA